MLYREIKYNDNHSHLKNTRSIMNTAFFSQAIIGNLHQSKISDVKKFIGSDILFKDSDVIFILHNGEQYSLRRTRNGKLILNK